PNRPANAQRRNSQRSFGPDNDKSRDHRPPRESTGDSASRADRNALRPTPKGLSPGLAPRFGVFFMLGLPLGVRFAHRRTGSPITHVQLMKQPLALPHAQLTLVSLL